MRTTTTFAIGLLAPSLIRPDIVTVVRGLLALVAGGSGAKLEVVGVSGGSPAAGVGVASRAGMAEGLEAPPPVPVAGVNAGWAGWRSCDETDWAGALPESAFTSWRADGWTLAAVSAGPICSSS